ncbi:MAG: electron transport complex subunit RsxG [Gammaproteobacteria bacterium]|nr:electron transport complex subunit RsxG [Gammaproteobacteria bacterium]
MGEMYKKPLKQVIAAAILGGFAMLGTTLVAVTYDRTHERIDENRRQVLMRQLAQLVPEQGIDNDLLSDVVSISVPAILNVDNSKVYRIRKDGQPHAVVISPVVARGYAGPIYLMVAVRYNGTLAGVRVLQHQETPGLGDKIDDRRSDWIYSFKDKSIDNPGPEDWKVKRDGGAFDQFTGASITPRGVVKAVHETLRFYHANRDYLYKQRS